MQSTVTFVTFNRNFIPDKVQVSRGYESHVIVRALDEYDAASCTISAGLRYCYSWTEEADADTANRLVMHSDRAVAIGCNGEISCLGYSSGSANLTYYRGSTDPTAMLHNMIRVFGSQWMSFDCFARVGEQFVAIKRPHKYNSLAIDGITAVHDPLWGVYNTMPLHRLINFPVSAEPAAVAVSEWLNVNSDGEEDDIPALVDPTVIEILAPFSDMDGEPVILHDDKKVNTGVGFIEYPRDTEGESVGLCQKLPAEHVSLSRVTEILTTPPSDQKINTMAGFADTLSLLTNMLVAAHAEIAASDRAYIVLAEHYINMRIAQRKAISAFHKLDGEATKMLVDHAEIMTDGANQLNAATSTIADLKCQLVAKDAELTAANNKNAELVQQVSKLDELRTRLSALIVNDNL